VGAAKYGAHVITMNSSNLEGQTVDANKPRVPAWVNREEPPKLWIDLREELSWLKPRPYLVEREKEIELRSTLSSMGFTVAEVDLAEGPKDPERVFLLELTRRLGLSEAGAGSWAALNDRLWDFLRSEDSTPVAVVITGLDRLARSDIYSFLRCVHNLLSLTEGAGLSDSAASRQIEYFFVGGWQAG
jgi:hypothetical protein